jgi:hypothetical protein
MVLRAQDHLSHGLVRDARVCFRIEAASWSHRIHTLILTPRNSLCWRLYNMCTTDISYYDCTISRSLIVRAVLDLIAFEVNRCVRFSTTTCYTERLCGADS